MKRLNQNVPGTRQQQPDRSDHLSCSTGKNLQRLHSSSDKQPGRKLLLRKKKKKKTAEIDKATSSLILAEEMSITFYQKGAALRQ